MQLLDFQNQLNKIINKGYVNETTVFFSIPISLQYSYKLC
jgi:hypothetical protein